MNILTLSAPIVSSSSIVCIILPKNIKYLSASICYQLKNKEFCNAACISWSYNLLKVGQYFS
jgi:hypothetical protein